MRYSLILGLGGIILGLILGFAAGRFWDGRGSDSTEFMSEKDANQSKLARDEGGKPLVKLSAEQIKEFDIEIGHAGPAKILVQKVLPGEIVLDPDKVACIASRISGIVVEVDKTLGDQVDEGEVMAVIDSRELADAKAHYLSARERLSLAQDSFEREKKLWEKKVSPEADYLNARQALAEAGITLRNARQKLYSLGFDQDYLEKLSDLPDASFTRYEIRAPFVGTVISRQIGLGELVTDASQIYRIADLCTVWVELTVYQKDLGIIREGQTVVIRADDINVDVNGTIEYIHPIIAESTRTAVARVVLSNAEGAWRPGTFVIGQVNVSTVDVPVAVARGAIAKLEGRDTVFIQTDEGFEPHTVQLGRADSESVEILSGLNPGQQYASANAFTLKAELNKSTFAGGDDD